jgi:hypothetical protein
MKVLTPLFFCTAIRTTGAERKFSFATQKMWRVETLFEENFV